MQTCDINMALLHTHGMPRHATLNTTRNSSIDVSRTSLQSYSNIGPSTHARICLFS
jgi:hypothetical protein